MAKDENKTDVVEIPKAEFEEMRRAIQRGEEHGRLLDDLLERLDVIQTAQLAGTGIDPRIAARALTPRKTVQFLEHYSRCAVPSKIQEGALIIEAYSVSAGDIVHIKEDEFKRIAHDFPKKMEANPNKFVAKLRLRPHYGRGEDGRPKMEMRETSTKVADLLEIAKKVG